ncbi:MAG: hypothetical protein JOY95_07130 [Silvibacterium sp.]|nr:hypothetical protein [Silvibacterium sp.]
MPGVVQSYVEKQKQNQPPAYTENLSGDAARAALFKERERLLNQLAAARSMPAEELPPGLYKSFGRLAQIHRELGLEPELDEQLRARLEAPADQRFRASPEIAGQQKPIDSIRAARQAGYEAQMEWLEGGEIPRTIKELQEVAHHAQRLAAPYAEAARRNGTTPDAREYLHGENNAIADWYWEQKPRICLAERLTAYVSQSQDTADLANAEQIIARNFARQLLSGVTSLDLSQQYATGDRALAARRHARALQNLGAFIDEACALGCGVDTGRAIAQGLQDVHRITLSSALF